jgi:hypothetical protein
MLVDDGPICRLMRSTPTSLVLWCSLTLTMLAGCGFDGSLWSHSSRTGANSYAYAEAEPFRIELSYGGDLWVQADSQAGLIRSLRAPLETLDVVGGPPAVVHVQGMSEAQRLGLARWTAQFLASRHPEKYPTRAPRPFVGATPSRLRVNGIEVAWDNTSDAPGLRGQVTRLIELTDGRLAIARGFH